MFFSLHGLIQAVGTYERTSSRPNKAGFYIVTTSNNIPLANRSLEYKGFAGIRYLHRLPKQYGGRYAALVLILLKYVIEYQQSGWVTQRPEYDA
jgi:hypothetical protein